MKEEDKEPLSNEIVPTFTQHSQKVVEHPAMFYSISEVYSIRKESINASNDSIYKKLSKRFQKIKKLRSEPNGNQLLSQEFDFESPSIRKDFKKLHDLYNSTSKANLIVKRRIDKMRNKVDKIRNEVERDEMMSVRELDANKILGKTVAVNGTMASQQGLANTKPSSSSKVT